MRVVSLGGPPVGLPAGAPPLANEGREAELKGCCCWPTMATGEGRIAGAVERSEVRRKAADMFLRTSRATVRLNKGDDG